MPLIVTPGQLNQRAEFYHQLSQLISAGLGLVPALGQISRNPPSFSFRKPLQHSLAALADGRAVAESLRTANWLPDLDLALIEAGERSGRIDACFRVLADYYYERARLAKLIIAQLIYPALLIHMAAFIFLILLPYAFSEFSANLTWLFIRAALVLSPIYLGTAFIIYAGQSRHGENWRALIEKLLRPLPLLGSGRRALALSRLSMALEALISAGVSVVEAWDIAANASGSPALRRAVADWKSQMAAGRTPAELVGAAPIFPETFANLYHSGEISGKLDETLRRLHDFYQEEGTHKLQLVAQWVPRFIYFAIVLLIAYFIIQFYTGYFNNINKLTNF
jgi:type II secretory pathway component PulF